MSICAAVIEPLPEASRFTVTFWHKAVGSILSSTVAVALHVAELPLPSVAVSATVFAPTSAHVNVNGVAVTVTSQLSVDPPSTSPTTILALPEASN